MSKELSLDVKRVPLSGALPGLKGDLYVPKILREFPFVIEAKHYKEIEFKNLLTAKSNDIYMFWEQTLRETAEVNEYFGTEKIPVLMFKWDRSKDFVSWSCDKISCENEFTIQAHGHKFKIALLDQWLPRAKVAYGL